MARRIALRTLLAAVVCGFFTFTLIVSISPLNEWAQETASCRGADRIERDVRDGGDVRKGGSTVGTTVFELRCTYDNGEEVRLVDNDQAVVKGFALAFLLGAIPGAALYLGRLALRQRRSSVQKAVTPGAAGR